MTFACCAFALVAALQVNPGQSRVPADDPALRGFDQEVDRYLALRTKLREELPVHVPNSTAKEITSTSDALARAVQRARPKPRRGVFFTAAASAAIKRRLNEVLSAPESAAVLEAIDDERPTIRAPRVYLRFPEASQLATMPPSVLAVLPKLPPELEYRIIGRDLVLRDMSAALVLDFIPNAVPRP
ncbi:MAG TPA: hypothetical protein VNJ02_16965 [Vicinamibacterales bacterium]|nr:hypothetical protein [Vicinamibacterales bacterium]